MVLFAYTDSHELGSSAARWAAAHADKYVAARNSSKVASSRVLRNMSKRPRLQAPWVEAGASSALPLGDSAEAEEADSHGLAAIFGSSGSRHSSDQERASGGFQQPGVAMACGRPSGPSAGSRLPSTVSSNEAAVGAVREIVARAMAPDAVDL